MVAWGEVGRGSEGRMEVVKRIESGRGFVAG